MSQTIDVCYFHPLRPAIELCDSCQKLLCKYCVCRDDDEVLCPDCKQLKIGERNKYKL